VKTVALVTDLWPSTSQPASGTFVRDQTAAVGRLGYRHVVLVPTLVAPAAHSRIWGGVVNGAQEGWKEPPSPHLLLRYRNARIPRGTELAVRSRSISRLLRHDGVMPDLVHGHFLLHAGSAAVRVAERLSVPSVLTVHGTDFRALTGSFGIQARYRVEMLAAAQAASRLLVVDRGMVDGLVSAGIPAERIKAISMGVDEEVFTLGERGVARRALGLAVDARVVLFVGRPTAEKGFDLLERAAAQLPGVQSFAAGPVRASETVTPLGTLSSSDLARFITAADVVCLPSFAEGTPVSLAEALACGTPVVATRVGGIPSLVDEERAGILIEAGDERALRDALAEAFERRWDRAAIRESSRPYWWSNLAPRIGAVYEDVLDVARVYRH
jgi:glycosyltransferase involved in cell wall biosynthesis